MQWDAVKRRVTQKVLQKVGIADKTSDNAFDQLNANFQTLGAFLTTFRSGLQGSLQMMEKGGNQNKVLASQIHAFLQAEIGESDASSSGEIMNFLHGTGAEDISVVNARVDQLQEAVGRFYQVSNDIGVSMVKTLAQNLEAAIIHPILRDEDLNAMTKKLLEEHEKLNLDYDSYKRSALSAGSPQDRERHDIKVRAAKERLEAHTRKVSEHLMERSMVRSRLIIHSILTHLDEFYAYHSHAASLLQAIGNLMTPLLDTYQIPDGELSTLSMLGENRPAPTPSASRERSPSSTGASSTSHNPNNGYPLGNNNNGRPSAPPSKPQPPSQPASSPTPPHGWEEPDEPPRSQPTPPPQPQAAPASPDLMGSSPAMSTGSFSTASPNAPPPRSPLIDSDFLMFGAASAAKPAASTSPQQPAPAPQPTPTPLNSDPFGFDDTPVHFTADDLLKPTPLAPGPSPVPPKTHSSPNPAPAAHWSSNNGATPSPPPHHANGGTPLDDMMKNMFSNTHPARSASPNPAMGVPPGGRGMGGPAGPMGGPPGSMGGVPLGGMGVPPVNPMGRGVPPGSMGGNPMGAVPMGNPPPGMNPGWGPAPNNNPYGFPPGARPPGPGMPPGGMPPGGMYPPGGGWGMGGMAMPPQPPPTPQTPEEAERSAVEPGIMAKIRGWSEKGGRKANLRALLATMHEIVWDGSGWDKISLGDVVSPSQTKKVYRKACLIVHPDKVANGTTEQKLLAQRIFETLREAHDAFKVENGEK